MPAFSFTTRRGKPRLESQQANAIVPSRLNRNLPYHKRSKLAQIQPNFKNTHDFNKYESRNDDNYDQSEEALQKKLWNHIEPTAAKPIAAPLLQSSFATRYPEHRESYIRTIFDKMETFLQKYGVDIEVVYHQCSLIVSTSKKQWDPYSIIKARDMIRLIARYVPFEHASKVMSDNVFSDIIETGKSKASRNQMKFIKRRARLIGPNGI